MFKGLEAFELMDIENDISYIFFEKEFGIPTINHTELLNAELSDAEIAKQLNIEQGHPLLRIDKLVFTHKAKPYEYRISHCITDEFKIRRML
jgi:DNA-binding GntR family transcriptional regulator